MDQGLATSVGGTVTGRGGNFLILDDAMNPAEAMSDVRRETVNQWYDGTPAAIAGVTRRLL